MKFTKTSLNQKGDTILEVLIAVAVLSLIVTAAFALANRNTQANRQAAERSEALKLAQAEMEKFKLYMSQAGNPLPGAGDFFCMNSAGDGYVPIGNADQIPDRNSDLSFQTFLYDKDECKSEVSESGFEYYVAIHRDRIQENTYTSIIRWPAVTGSGVDESTVVHRVYPELASLGTIGPPDVPTVPTPPPPPPPPVVLPPAPPPSSGGDANAGIASGNSGNSSGSNSSGNFNLRQRYSRTFRNISANNPVDVQGCTWNWGDGTQDRNRACYNGQTISHSWFGTGPGCKTVTLTVQLKNGKTATATYRTSVPWGNGERNYCS